MQISLVMYPSVSPLHSKTNTNHIDESTNSNNNNRNYNYIYNTSCNTNDIGNALNNFDDYIHINDYHYDYFVADVNIDMLNPNVLTNK